MTNQEAARKLIRLILENPKLHIKAIVDSDLFDGDHSWMLGRTGEPEIKKIYTYKDNLYDDLIDLQDSVSDSLDDFIGSDEELDKKISKIIAELECETVIVIPVMP